jgi:hypothetical protein
MSHSYHRFRPRPAPASPDEAKFPLFLGRIGKRVGNAGSDGEMPILEILGRERKKRPH